MAPEFGRVMGETDTLNRRGTGSLCGGKCGRKGAMRLCHRHTSERAIDGDNGTQPRKPYREHLPGRRRRQRGQASACQRAVAGHASRVRRPFTGRRAP